MRVLVDCTQITRNKAGVGVYGLNLVQGLRKCRQDDLDLWLLVQSDDSDFCFEEDGAHIVRVPSRLFRHLTLRFLMEQIYIPWILWRHKIDVLHSLHYSFPLWRTRARKIVTVHDMTSFIMPEVHLRVKVAYFRFFINAASRFADALIFVSKSAREDWKHFFPKSLKPAYMIYLGKGTKFRSDIDADEVDRVIRKYGLTRPYIFHIGTIEPRKNLTRLVAAFAQLSDSFPSHSLVIAGMNGWKCAELYERVSNLHLQSRVVFTGFVAEEDKPGLIAGAEVFVYPSLYEGFGIPVLEALACGTPSLASNVSAIPEVAGDAALLVDPRNADDIARGLESLLADADLRASLRAKGIRQAGRFSWSQTTEETLKIYATAVGNNTSQRSSRAFQPIV